MNLGLLLRSIEDALKPLVTAAGGDFRVAETELDAFNLLNVAADRWRAVMVATGGKSEETEDLGGYVAEGLTFFLQVPKPMTSGSAKALHRDATGRGTNFMERLDWIKTQVRSLTTESAEIDTQASRFIRYKSWDWLRVDGAPLLIRAARVDFEIKVILDDPDTESTATLTTATGVKVEIVGNYLHVTSAVLGTTKRIRLLDLP